jgi:sterol desaturase/sphingolipid hydroxylase (fatty acid hydroxylase superfamily)
MLSAMKNTLDHVRQELETPHSERPLGSGWLSGAGGLLAGLTGILMVVALRNPSMFTTPELAAVRDSGFFKPFLYLVLVLGYLFSITSMLLRKDMTLGVCAMALTLVATTFGSLPMHADYLKFGHVFLGLDFFVLNVLFLGFLFVPVERLFPRVHGQTVLREEWREDIFYYLVSSMFVQVLTWLTMEPSKVLSSTGWFDAVRAFDGAMPWIVQLAVVMFVTDLTQYWVHRAFHRVPALWRFHAVHHSAKSLDWVAGARMHFLEIVILRSLTATPMFVLGFSPSVVQAYILIVYVYSSFIHSNLGTDFGVAEKVVAVPRFHHWHHGIEREAIDVNFAIHFPILDRLFGTHHMPEGRWPEGYGIEGHPVPRGYWAQFLYPFRRDKAAPAD